jgi:hypothetical protein
MDQSKRNFLKILPVAAMLPTALAIGEVKAAGYEVSAQKKYLIVIPDDVVISDQAGERLRSMLKERGIDATVIAGAEGLKVYELDLDA